MGCGLSCCQSNLTTKKCKKQKSIVSHENCSTQGKMKGLREMIFLFALINVISKTDASLDEIRVDGDDFASYDLSSRTWLIQTVRRHTFVFNFKTVNPNGMLIYVGSGDELKDFVMLDLVKGKLR